MPSTSESITSSVGRKREQPPSPSRLSTLSSSSSSSSSLSAKQKRKPPTSLETASKAKAIKNEQVEEPENNPPPHSHSATDVKDPLNFRTLPTDPFERSLFAQAFQLNLLSFQNIAHPQSPTRLLKFPSHTDLLLKLQGAVFFCQSAECQPSDLTVAPSAPGCNGSLDLRINKIIAEKTKHYYDTFKNDNAVFHIVLQNRVPITGKKVPNEWVYYGLYKRGSNVVELPDEVVFVEYDRGIVEYLNEFKNAFGCKVERDLVFKVFTEERKIEVKMMKKKKATV